MKNALALITLTLSVAFAGCSTYHVGYGYQPAPAVAETEQGDRALATVVGVRRAEDGRPAMVEVRFRLEAAEGGDLELDDESLSLVAADLTELPLATAEPLEGGWTLLFAVPDGRDPDEIDLEGLSLSWRVVANGVRQRGTIAFRREVRPAALYSSYAWYDPYWYGGHHYGFYSGHYSGHYGHHRHSYWRHGVWGRY